MNRLARLGIGVMLACTEVSGNPTSRPTGLKPQGNLMRGADFVKQLFQITQTLVVGHARRPPEWHKKRKGKLEINKVESFTKSFVGSIPLGLAMVV